MSGGDIVAAGVAEHVRQRLLGGHAAAGAADHGDQLTLIVDTAGALGQDDRLLRPDDGGRRLQEQLRLGWRLCHTGHLLAFRHVRGVVDGGRQDIAGADGRQQPHGVQGDRLLQQAVFAEEITLERPDTVVLDTAVDLQIVVPETSKQHRIRTGWGCDGSSPCSARPHSSRRSAPAPSASPSSRRAGSRACSAPPA